MFDSHCDHFLGAFVKIQPAMLKNDIHIKKSIPASLSVTHTYRIWLSFMIYAGRIVLSDESIGVCLCCIVSSRMRQYMLTDNSHRRYHEMQYRQHFNARLDTVVPIGILLL